LSSKAITRVQAAIVIVVIILGVAAGAYFAIPRSATPTTSTSTPVAHPDTIVDEVIGSPDTLDPATDYEIYGAAVIQNVYEQLLFFKGDKADQVVPWLAQSYDMSPDGLTYTFHLRSGVNFTDGTPLDANAVYFSLMRAMIIDDPDGPAWAMDQVVRGGMNFSKQYNNAGPSAPTGYGDKYTQGELQDFINAKGIEVIDPMTVAIHLEHPYVAWPFVMAFSVTAIVSPTAFKAHWTAPTDGTPYIQGATCGDYHNVLNPWPADNMVGSGPYMLKSWDKATLTLLLVRNENYWGGPDKRGLAPVPNVVLKEVDDDNTRVLDFKTGVSDLSAEPTNGPLTFPGGLIFQFVDKDTWYSQHKLVSVSPDYQVFPTQGLWPQFTTQSMSYNQKIRGADGKLQTFQPFEDIRIRHAFTLLFNRTAYLHDVLYDFAIPAAQIVPPGMLGYNASIQPTPYDVATAKQLLLDAGKNPITPANAFNVSNPRTIEIPYNLGNSGREAAATLLATAVNNLASATGLYATVVGLQGTEVLRERRTGQLNIELLGWWVDYVDPDDFLVPFASGTAGFFPTRIGYNNPAVNTLISEQASISDTAKREQVISQIEEMVNNDWVYLWLQHGGTYAVSRSWLHERANATVASGVASYNPAMYGYFFYEIEKGSSMSSPSAYSTEPLFLLLNQLAAASLLPTKRSI
jgi:peptide/nickel transport system substrate-binding protein